MKINNLFRHLTYHIFAPGTLIREKYEAFRELLEHDRAANEMVAEFEELFYSRKTVDFNRLSARYERLSAEVFHMMEALFKIAPASYLNLKDYYRKMDFYVRFALAPPEVESSPPFILMLDDPECDIELAGGKAGNLWKLIHKSTLNVPPSFAVTTRAFNYFLEYNNLIAQINDVLSEVDIYIDSTLRDASDRLMTMVSNAEMPEFVEGEIKKAVSRLNGVNFAVRSSAAYEDSSLSFAGQYKTLLNVSAENITSACKEVFVSKYSPEAIFYRIQAGLHDLETPMAVLVMEMAETACAGVMYTSDPSAMEASNILITAVAGSGEKVVNGTAEPALFLVSKKEPEVILRKGTLLPEIKDSTISELAEAGLEIEKIFENNMDIEWAVNSNGAPAILQVRPLNAINCICEEVPAEKAFEDLNSENLICSGGICASRGIVRGRVHIIKDEREIDETPHGSVVVARAATPEFARLKGKAAAVITEYGSAASHFASVAREASIPFIAGMKGASALLETGMEVTVDATRCIVLRGIMETASQGEQADKKEQMRKKTRFEERLEYMLKFISPLRLGDPDSPEFTPEGCRSLHDIIRFTHETGLKEMFSSTSRTSSKRHGALKLVSDLPMKIFILDVNDGIMKEAVSQGQDSVELRHITSIPMLALWKGMCNPGISWSDFDHFDWKSFDSVVMAGGIVSKNSAEFASYAVISKQYMNLNMRFGYHFTIVDTLCSPDEISNYINIRFAGGGGDYKGRRLRLLFLKTILIENGFTVRHTGDLIDARLQHGDIALMEERLDILGRLLGVTRLMDMTLKSEEDVKRYIDDFMHGDYSFTASMNKGDNG